MKTIELKEMTLVNFKKARFLHIHFDHITNIFGYNGTGKTTIFDAFLWNLFGKDSNDRKDLEIKELDSNNKLVDRRVDHEVKVVLLIDGNVVELKKAYREKWSKIKGEPEEQFKGHETEYFWNDVPMKKEDYERNIAEILPEQLFKMITNISYFNSIPWQNRRAKLVEMAGTIDDQFIIDSLGLETEQKNNLFKAIKQGKDKDNFGPYKAELSAKKKKINDELKQMPGRFDEAKRNMPDAEDIASIQTKISEAKKTITAIDTALSSVSEAEKQRQQLLLTKVKKVGDLKMRAQKIEGDINNAVIAARSKRQREIENLKSSLRSSENEIPSLTRTIEAVDKEIHEIRNKQVELRNEYNTVFESPAPEYPANENCDCPMCGQRLPEEKLHEKKDLWLNAKNNEKAERLKNINAAGIREGKFIAELEVTIADKRARLNEVNQSINNLKQQITTAEVNDQHEIVNERKKVDDDTLNNAELADINKQIKELEIELAAPPTASAPDNSDKIARKNELNQLIEQWNKSITMQNVRKEKLDRISELERMDKEMNISLTALEGEEFAIAQFIKQKMDEVSSRVNSKFSLVRFKMFEEQINGGVAEACTTLINGVPYQDANKASQINAGLDIINALSEHYNVTAPIFIDNRESVVDIIRTNAQLINLIVSAPDMKLRISSNQMAEAV